MFKHLICKIASTFKYVCRSDGTGRLGRLKIFCFRACRFESDLRYHHNLLLLTTSCNNCISELTLYGVVMSIVFMLVFRVFVKNLHPKGISVGQVSSLLIDDFL